VLSVHPVVSIWQAHRQPAVAGVDRFASVRQAFADLEAQTALVWRNAWQVQVAALSPAQALLAQALCRGTSLGDALHQLESVEPEFEFEPWLVDALRCGWLAGASLAPLA
jgi:hypothetical protein